MTDGADWPLPSQSFRVRVLLYLSEGLIIGGGVTLFLFGVVGAFFVDIETGSFNPKISTVEAVFLLLLLFFLFRAIGFVKASRRSSREDPPEQQDWKETRRWIWVIAMALPVGAILLGVSVFLWGWWSVFFLQDAALLMLGTVMVGLLLNLYVYQRIGMKIL